MRGFTINIPATRHTYAISATFTWRGVIGCVSYDEPATGFLFCLALGYRHHAFDEKGMLRHGAHTGIKGITRFATTV